MKPKVLLYSYMTESIKKKLENYCNVIFIDKNEPNFNNKIKPHLAYLEGIIGDGLEINKKLIQRAEKLKVISNISAGFDNLDIETINDNEIIATNTPGVLTETTADLIFSLILTTARNIPQLDRYIKEGKWESFVRQDWYGTDVNGKILGIIGMGEIGKAIARRAKFGFNMPILYHNRSKSIDGEKELDATYCSMEQLLTKSDFICLMTPLTKETHYLIGEKEFSLMKDTAIFINGSRGSTVDEKALIQALKNKVIASAGLDVYQKEPIENSNPLLQMDHIVTLPHVGANTIENKLAMDKLATENLIKGLKGETPYNPIKI